MKCAVIGAGIGGMTVAALLANEGHEVHVYEKNEAAGGKMNEVRAAGYRFDTGPSLLTMPFVLEQLFEACGRQLADYLELQPLEPLCHYFYRDGTRFDNFSDRERTMEEIKRFAPEDAGAYSRFLDYAEQLYERTAPAFLFNPLYEWQDLKQLNLLDVLRIDALRTVSDRVDSYFQSSYLRRFFKRFTTYNGSSPYQAPATLNVIPHVELNQGGFYVKGGLYRVAEALQKLGEELGARYHFEKEVKTIRTDGKKTEGLDFADGTKEKADIVISNSDATETYRHLLDATRSGKIPGPEPSCSGFVLLLGCNRRFDGLAHHNIFFSNDYEVEFRQIFREKKLPADPTIYVADTSHSDPDHAPEGGSNLFVLVNAPYLTGKRDWDDTAKRYGSKVVRKLEQAGLEGLEESIEYRQVITPPDFYRNYRSHRGSIYGTSSNSRLAAFLRPRNKSPKTEGLYLVGGSTHPGGGIPLVMLSAFHAHELIGRKYKEN